MNFAADLLCRKIIFAGSIYDQTELNSLRYFSSYYFHGHSSGGTNPSLLEAMACGCNIIAHDNAFNKYVLGSEADYFSKKEDIAMLLISPKETTLLNERKELNILKIKKEYNWEKVIDQYETAMVNAVKSNKK